MKGKALGWEATKDRPRLTDEGVQCVCILVSVDCCDSSAYIGSHAAVEDRVCVMHAMDDLMCCAGSAHFMRYNPALSCHLCHSAILTYSSWTCGCWCCSATLLCCSSRSQHHFKHHNSAHTGTITTMHNINPTLTSTG
jgi:hypothetical protein